MDDLPPELQGRRQEIHNKIMRRARALRRRRAAAIIAAIAIVVAIPAAAIAWTTGNSAHGHTRVAVSGPNTQPGTDGSGAPTSTIQATTTTPSSTANSTATTLTQPATASTSLVCHNSMNPACGPLHYEPPITDQAATFNIVGVSPSSPTVGETVTFTFHAKDPDSRIDTSDMWCNNGGYTFGDESTTTQCESVCAAIPGYGAWNPPPPQPSDLTFTLKHTYDRAGTYRAKFGITAEPCGPRPSKASTAISVTITAASPNS